MAWFAYIFLRFFIELMRILPFRALYVLSDGLAWVLFRVIKYRKQVILDNLRRAFPELSEQELRDISRRYYQHLADVTLETLKSFTLPLPELKRRCVVLNPELVQEYLDRGQSVILVGSHVNNWEYAAIALPLSLRQPMYGVYKPLSNKLIDTYMARKRARGSISPIPMDAMLGVMRKYQKIVSSYMLIADQSPNHRKRAHWVTFFGTETASLPGVDILARNFSYPVFHYQIKKVRRGFYEITCTLLCDHPSDTTEGSITQWYYQRLEAEISASPEQWLWSHKRWKMKRYEGNGE